ncbi:3-carboxy-cis,cis-muconate cycloisomerase [Rhodobacteraceae bacterium KLH11]|nr:3-carboxy-cis,cis-muconate cycloisomerase [Rhodobacteraceae bacterium KLH11]
MSVDIFSHPWLGALIGDDILAQAIGADAQLDAMLDVEAAYPKALAQCNLCQKDLADRAVHHIRSVPLSIDDLRIGTKRDGLAIPQLVRQLRANADADVAAVIHTGLTSQDVMDTALILTLKAANQLFRQRLEQLEQTLTDLDRRFGENKMTGRTRMQLAHGIRVHDRLGIWQRPLVEHQCRLTEIESRLLRIQLGGAVGDRAAWQGAGQNVADALAKLLDLAPAGTAWHSDRSALVEYAGWLALVTGSLGKIGQDISLMAQQGIEEISIAGGGSSSAMPHKQNPIGAELLVAMARFNATLVAGMQHSMVHEQERSGAAWTLEWMLLPQMVMATGSALNAASDICARITRIGDPES